MWGLMLEVLGLAAILFDLIVWGVCRRLIVVPA
jgi:hypothetical protein